MDVEVTQLQTGGDQKLFQGTEAAPVKVGDGAVLDTTSEQFDARLSRTIRSIADQGIQKIELKLTPEHLGNVVVELTRSEGSGQNGQPQEQHRDPKREESENFLHQLKLGLLEQETAPV